MDAAVDQHDEHSLVRDDLAARNALVRHGFVSDQPVFFGWDEVAGFVAPYGWAETAQPGRIMPVSEIERTVHCVKVAA